MKTIVIFYKERRINLLEKTPEFILKISTLEMEETVIHTSIERMANELDVFFDDETFDEISFVSDNFEKLFNDFQSQFKLIEAAGGLVKNSDNKMLVIQRFGIPDLPKGKIEKDESPEEAALREVSEECGITDMKIIDEAVPSFHIYFLGDEKMLKKTYWFNMLYLGNESPVPQSDEAITKVGWFDSQAIKEFKTKTYTSLQQYFN